MSKVQQNKLVFFETRDSGEISLALQNYFKVTARHGVCMLRVAGIALCLCVGLFSLRHVTMAEVPCC